MSIQLRNNRSETIKIIGQFAARICVDRSVGWVSGKIYHKDLDYKKEFATFFKSIFDTQWDIDFPCLDGKMPEELRKDPLLAQVDDFIQDNNVKNDFAETYRCIVNGNVIAYENGYLDVDKTWFNMNKEKVNQIPELPRIHPVIRRQLYEMLSIYRKTTGIFYAFEAKDDFPGIKGSVEIVQLPEIRLPVFIGYQDESPNAVVYYINLDGFLKVSETTLPKEYLREHYAMANQYLKFTTAAKESFSALRESLAEVIE